MGDFFEDLKKIKHFQDARCLLETDLFYLPTAAVGWIDTHMRPAIHHIFQVHKFESISAHHHTRLTRTWPIVGQPRRNKVPGPDATPVVLHKAFSSHFEDILTYALRQHTFSDRASALAAAQHHALAYEFLRRSKMVKQPYVSEKLLTQLHALLSWDLPQERPEILALN